MVKRFLSLLLDILTSGFESEDRFARRHAKTKEEYEKILRQLY